MTTQSEAAKPAAEAVRRSLFKRPKWAASNTTKTDCAAPKVKNEDFFSRADETFAKFSKEEEEREKRRQARRAEKQKPKSPTRERDDSKPSPKRRRLSPENESDSANDDDDGERLSDIEAERAEEEAAVAQAAAQAENKELLDVLDQGKAFVKGDTTQLGIGDEQIPPPTPGKLPSDVPRIPNDEQCDSIRARQPKLAGYDNRMIRLLALKKWELEHEEKLQSPMPNSPGRQLRSLVRAAPASRSSDMAIRTSPSKPNGHGADKPAVIELDDDGDEVVPTVPAVDTARPGAANPHHPDQPERDLGDNPPARDETLNLDQPELTNSPATEPIKQTGKLSTPEQVPIRIPPSLPDAKPEISVKAPAPAKDPVVQLLVTSEMPNTRGLIINRKISQRFKEVREYWCTSNGLPLEMKSKVLLYWKKRRLYDSQSCKQLGFAAGSDDSVIYTKGDNVFDDYQGKIHLVASAEGVPGDSGDRSTQEATSASSNPSDQTQGPAAEAVPEEEYRVIMRAPNYPDCKIIVKSSTLISRMMGAFKRQGNVPAEKNLALMFDGELLQPNSTVGQTDIGDLDHIDVYVR